MRYKIRSLWLFITIFISISFYIFDVQPKELTTKKELIAVLSILKNSENADYDVLKALQLEHLSIERTKQILYEVYSTMRYIKSEKAYNSINIKSLTPDNKARIQSARDFVKNSSLGYYEDSGGQRAFNEAVMLFNNYNEQIQENILNKMQIHP